MPEEEENKKKKKKKEEEEEDECLALLGECGRFISLTNFNAQFFIH